jgi:uncharacterized protein YndB with AHSA1/START domain
MSKRLMIVAAVGVALLLLAAVSLPSSYEVRRQVDISAPPDVVFAALTRLDERPQWLAWYEREPSGKAYTTGQPAQVGATFGWEGEEMGVGSATLTEVVPGQRLEFALSFKQPFTLECGDTFTVTPSPGGTTVSWTNHGRLEGPQRLMGLVIDRFVGPDYKRGLANLKRRLEAPSPAGS